MLKVTQMLSVVSTVVPQTFRYQHATGSENQSAKRTCKGITGIEPDPGS